MVLAQLNIQVYACCNQTCGNMWQYHSVPLNIHIIIHWLHMWFECAVYIHTMRMHHSSNAGMCGALCTQSPPSISTTISGQETLTPRSVWSALQWPGPHSCSFSRFTRFHVIIAWSLHQLHETDIWRWQFCLECAMAPPHCSATLPKFQQLLKQKSCSRWLASPGAWMVIRKSQDFSDILVQHLSKT